jgi:c-di-GMP-binding flagellar brake protein YcgR
LIVSIDKERRDFFRVELNISVGRNRYRLKNIGAAGIGIYRRAEGKELELGEEYPFKMTLPLINEVISGIIRIVDISDRAYHCQFIAPSEEDKEKIHMFVLERQKEELRERRARHS